MPPRPGEETLATVYADLHTYFGAPSPRPFLHRFDKSCYFYTYYNSTRQTSRIEVAINPGTPDQAAFNGFLESVKIINHRNFPTLVSIVVDGSNQSGSSPSSARGRDPDEWRLASADPRDTGTTKYKIHTVDVYFWVQEDARLIVEIFQKLLQPHQLDVEEEPHEQHQQPEQEQHHANPVVQNLENLAISDPMYHKDKQHDAHSTQLPPPPPTSGFGQQSVYAQATSPSPPSASTGVSRQASVKPEQTYAPLAYNPAAPAAPEPIAHREDTPPPADAADGTGLGAAVHDNPHAHQQGYHGAPGPSPAPYGHYGSPPPQSFGPHGGLSPAPPSFGPQSPSATHTGTSFSPPPTAATSTSPDPHHHSTAAEMYSPHNDPNAHIFGQEQQPVMTPGTQFYQSLDSHSHPHKPLQHVQPQYPDYLSQGQSGPTSPLGGYSNYQYGQQGQQQHAGRGQDPYSVHGQVYRPTESEHAAHHKPSRTSTSGSRKPSNSEKLEKGVGRLFKKIEKKIG